MTDDDLKAELAALRTTVQELADALDRERQLSRAVQRALERRGLIDTTSLALALDELRHETAGTPTESLRAKIDRLLRGTTGPEH